MSEQEKKQRIIQLLTMPKKQMLKFNEEELISIIQEVDQIRVESVQDRRFLGKLKRCRELQTKIKATQGSPRKTEEKKLQKKPNQRKSKTRRRLFGRNGKLQRPLE